MIVGTGAMGGFYGANYENTVLLVKAAACNMPKVRMLLQQLLFLCKY